MPISIKFRHERVDQLHLFLRELAASTVVLHDELMVPVVGHELELNLPLGLSARIKADRELARPPGLPVPLQLIDAPREEETSPVEAAPLLPLPPSMDYLSLLELGVAGEDDGA